MASSGRGAGGKAAKDVHKSYRLRAGRRLFSGESCGVFYGHTFSWENDGSNLETKGFWGSKWCLKARRQKSLITKHGQANPEVRNFMAEMMNFMAQWAQCQWKRKTLVADSILSFCWLNVLNPQTFGDASRAMLYRSLMFVCGIPYTEVIGTIGRIWMTILRLILVPSGWCFPPRRRLSRILPIDLLKDIKRLHTDWSTHRTIPKNMGLTMGNFPMAVCRILTERDLCQFSMVFWEILHLILKNHIKSQELEIFFKKSKFKIGNAEKKHTVFN